MRLHCSAEMERFAMRSHYAWAGISAASANIALVCFYLLWPIAMYTIGPYGKFLFAQLIFQIALVLFGLGGFVFHLLGAKDHKDNLKKLERLSVMPKDPA